MVCSLGFPFTYNVSLMLVRKKIALVADDKNMDKMVDWCKNWDYKPVVI